MIVDTYYFLIHLYMKDLERIDDDLKPTIDISTKTYHSVYIYLESYPSPYMEFQKVATDLRKELNVAQAIGQMLYPHKAILRGSHQQRNASQIVNEYIGVKNILVNNSQEVSTTRLFPNNVKRITKDLRFNKKILQYTLLDMLRFRKLLLLKRRVFLFTIMYEGSGSGKGEAEKKRRAKIERNIDNAFAYINTNRTLRAIGYQPKNKIISHEDNLRIDEGSDIDLVESMKNFNIKIADKNFKEGGLLSRNTSKLSFRRGVKSGIMNTGFKRSTTFVGVPQIAEDFKVDADGVSTKKDYDEQDKRLIGLGDDTDNSEEIDKAGTKDFVRETAPDVKKESHVS